MDVKMGDYVPGSTVSTVCRCCLAEGCYKDISTEYFWMGKREVYSEMLSETLNLSIAFSKSGAPNSNSRLICEACISKLRDATDFKKQVQQCEKMFMQHLDPGSQVEIEVTPASSKDVKVECVKIENEVSDDDDVFEQGAPDAFDRPTLDDDDDYDDADDQPLTSLATAKATMKKERGDILDIMSNKQITVKRKIPETETRASKKTKKDITKPSASKQQTVKAKKSKDLYDPARNNALTILTNTTAYPFRVNDKRVLCVYCQDLYEDPDAFRCHMEQEHRAFKMNVVLYSLPKSEFIKADITNLRCRICNERYESLESIAVHLQEQHEIIIQNDEKLGIMPYMLLKNALSCVICHKNFPSILHLNRHTITHFSSFMCDFCGRSFVASTGLLRHIRSKHQDYKAKCNICHKVFPTIEAKNKHKRSEKSCLAYSCPKCPERFQGYPAKRKHMESVHGLKSKYNRCSHCDMNFSTDAAYYEHFRLHHSVDCLLCKHCGLRFASAYRLKRHLAKHS